MSQVNKSQTPPPNWVTFLEIAWVFCVVETEFNAFWPCKGTQWVIAPKSWLPITQIGENPDRYWHQPDLAAIWRKRSCRSSLSSLDTPFLVPVSVRWGKQGQSGNGGFGFDRSPRRHSVGSVYVCLCTLLIEREREPMSDERASDRKGIQRAVTWRGRTGGAKPCM